MELKFDPKHDSLHGYLTCDSCNVHFETGGSPLHDKDCLIKKQGYVACTYNFGPAEAKKVNRAGIGSTWGLTLDVLAENFPDLVDKENQGVSAEERLSNPLD